MKKLSVMSHFSLLPVIMAVFLTNVQCSDVIGDTKRSEIPGLWDPIEMDKSQLVFSSDGGRQTVTATNYSVWWINGGHEGTILVDGGKRWDVKNYTFSTSTDGEKACTFDILEGGWYHATVPNTGKSNQLIVTVDPNETGQKRLAFIMMESGDAFTSIAIEQKE